MKIDTCTITGHRPQRFKFKYNEHFTLCRKIKKSLRAEIIRHYNQIGVRKFWVGGAVGADMWAAEIILELQTQKQFADMELHIALPFSGHDARFSLDQKARLRDILTGCTSVIFCCDDFCTEAYQIRNYHMVDQSAYTIAVYDNDHAKHSGTGQTVRYAQKNSCHITLIHPDTAEVMSI